MHVVGHQHESVHANRVPTSDLAEDIEESPVIDFLVKDGCAIVATLNHVDTEVRYEYPAQTRHGDQRLSKIRSH